MTLYFEDMEIEGKDDACSKDKLQIFETDYYDLNRKFLYCKQISDSGNDLKQKVVVWKGASTKLLFKVTTTSERPLSKSFNIYISPNCMITFLVYSNKLTKLFNHMHCSQCWWTTRRHFKERWEILPKWWCELQDSGRCCEEIHFQKSGNWEVWKI